MATNINQMQRANQFPAMLNKHIGEIAKALPQHLNPERMSRIALTAFRRNPKLAECDPASVFAAVIQSSQLGLEPDTLGRSYLIPYGKECQFVPGWKGLVDLTNRSGQATTWTGAAYEGDQFEYQLGDSPFVKHQPMGEDDPGKITHVYAIGRVKGAEWPVIEVWPISRVWRHRDRYNKQGKRHYSFENPEMYARKVVLLQVLKYMPASPEMAHAIALNDAAEVGPQNLTVEDAIEGTWVPVAEESPQQAPKQPPQRHQEATRPQQQPKTEPAPEAPRTLTQSSQDDWRALINKLSITGIALQLAMQSQLVSVDKGRYVLALDNKYKNLNQEKWVSTLQDAISQAIGRKIEVVIEGGSLPVEGATGMFN